jgi:RHS repeat-associated protein
VGRSTTVTGDRFKFAGQQYDTESGLYYDRARYYDANVGRFISQDPLGFTAADPNLYRYVSNQPLVRVDPTGKGPWDRWFGYDDPTFRGWFHRKFKGRCPKGTQSPKEVMKEAYEEWVNSGKPDAEGHRTELSAPDNIILTRHGRIQTARNAHSISVPGRKVWTSG